MAKCKVPVKISRDKDNIYIQYGGAGADIERIRIETLRKSLAAFLTTLTSTKYEADIRVIEYEEKEND